MTYAMNPSASSANPLKAEHRVILYGLSSIISDLKCWENSSSVIASGKSALFSTISTGVSG